MLLNWNVPPASSKPNAQWTPPESRQMVMSLTGRPEIITRPVTGDKWTPFHSVEREAERERRHRSRRENPRRPPAQYDADESTYENHSSGFLSPD